MISFEPFIIEIQSLISVTNHCEGILLEANWANETETETKWPFKFDLNVSWHC